MVTTEREKEANAGLLKKYGEFFKTQLADLINVSDGAMWDENRVFMPIQVNYAPVEHAPVIELVASDNTMMTKVLSVLTSLCVEVKHLKEEAFERHFMFLSVYEEYSDNNVSSQMDAICALNAFTSRCDETLRNFCSQILAIYNEQVVNLNGIQLHFYLNHIGELFTIIILLEMLIANTSIPSNWSRYCKLLHSYSRAPQTLGLSEEKLNALVGAVNIITSKIMNDDIVQNSLRNLSGLRKTMIGKKSSLMAAEFTQYLKQGIINLEKLIQEQNSIDNMYKCIKFNALFVLNAYLIGSNDRKIFKSLLELNTKAHSVHVVGTSVWFPEQFLHRHVPTLCDKHEKISQTMLKARQAFITAYKTGLARETATTQVVASEWVLAMENMFSPKHHKLNAAEMNLHTKILLEGMDLVSTTNYSMLTLINLHLSLGIPLPKSSLMFLFDIIDIVKSLKDVIDRHRNQIILSINMIVQHLMFQAISSLSEVKKSLMTDKNYANKRLDELTCTVIAERALRGAATRERLAAAGAALSFIPQTTYLEDSYARLCLLLDKIQTLSKFTTEMEKQCDCSWLLWHPNIIPIYFDQNFSNQLNVLKLKYFVMVLEDSAALLHKTDKLFKANKSEKFLDSSKDMIVDKVLTSISQNIETNLRLHIHSHLQLDVVNPFTFDMTKKVLLTANHFRMVCVYMSVVPTVERYLSMMYYNLTTVVLSDWKTYGEMRQMARFKFNLSTVQDNLPTQTLEQGLDVLEIMRNIHIFVSKYLYNLNNQIFIEKSSNNKHLNSINIRHIGNSIRTHGAGIMNTTVNFTYQFLKKKFFTFSQFMFDEHIKSRLIKDLRNFKENAVLNGNMYPYKSAEKFNRGIRTLGLNEEGLSYLDLFRDLVSQIGNAMGYVRMVRSGGRHCAADATLFLPTLDSGSSFKRLAEEDHLTSKTIQSSENLDHNIDGLISDFIQGSEYFMLLVDVFAPVFRNPKNVHLKNFFVIVPPLTLNFIEHMILSKDKMSKKNKVGAAFTDDGFAMGIAYILRLLDQDSNFEALHWFDSIWKYIRDERTALEDQKLKGSTQLQQALALTEKKIKILEEEYKLLYYSLSSARIFFR